MFMFSCRFEKNTPECTKSYFNLFFFPGVIPPDPRHWWLCPQTPGRGAREGNGREGSERAGRGKGDGGEGKGSGKFASLPSGDRRP